MLNKPFKEDHKVDGVFGEQRSYGFHSGEDWNGTGGGNTDCGYKLYPLKECEITHASEASSGYGNIIVFKITGTFGERWIRYCHCREILVRSGLVKPGEAIATLGTSGNSTACHLHWDVIKKPLQNWRTYAKTETVLNEYFEEPTAFFNKYKDVEDDSNMKWFITFLSERGLTIDDEGKIREIFGKAQDYDDKVKELVEQVKSANEALSDKSLEVVNLTERVENLENKIIELEAQYNQTRTERDKALWEKEKLLAENGILISDNERLRKNNNLMGYTWMTRFLSLFKRG